MTPSRSAKSRPYLGAVVFSALLLAASSCKDHLDLTGPIDPPRTASIAIRSSGFDPVAVAVRPGGQVTFTNRDSVPHQAASDDHPTHMQCPELNGPVLAPGQSFRATMPDMDGACFFHDEFRLEDRNHFSGEILVCRRECLFGCC